MVVCPRCGEENPEHGRFCLSCAAPLRAAEAAALVRKTVTVLFCDVTGSTSLGERLDPETMRRVMFRYFGEMRKVLERYGGSVEKFIGDAVMAVFGVPTVHEDDALRAVRAADEMRRQLALLNDDLEIEAGVRLESRIGINTGEVVAGDPTTGQTVATGDAVNIAARLQQAAAPGEILLGKETYRLVHGRVRAGPLEAFPLKGKEQPVAPWRLDQVLASAQQTLRRLTSPLVGRDSERTFLEEVYERALTEENCQLVTVLGAAGVGKSRLAQEVGAKLLGARVVTGRCLPYGDGITFWPVVEIVKQVAGIVNDDSPAEARRKIGALSPPGEVALVCERVAGMIGLGESVAQAEEAFWALRKLFESAARRRPLVLVFEDIHWAEPKLLDLLEYLVGWSSSAPIMLLCLARPDLVERRPGWTGERPDTNALVLEPLAEPEVGALMDNLLGSALLERATARKIAEAAEGNPLFVEELLRMLIDEGVLVFREGIWVPVRDLSDLAATPTISAVLAARLDRLEPEEQTIVQCAAVMGKQFWWGAVRELAPRELRAEVSGWLQSLVRKHLVVPDEALGLVGEDGFRFSHILIRDAAYASLPKSRRADLHERFAEWLERKAGDRAAEYAEILGYHLEQAYRALIELGPHDEHAHDLALRAGELLSSAGGRAFARDDMPAAINLLRRAADLLARDANARTELLTLLGSALIKTGAFEQADSVLADAIEHAGDARALQLRATIERQFLRMFTEPEQSTSEILEVGSSVVPELEALGDELGLSKAWQLLGELHTIACRWGARAEALERALEHARRAGDRRQQASLVGPLGHALLYGPTSVEEAMARCDRFLHDSHGNRAVEAAMLSTIGCLRAMRGEIDDGRQLCARAAAIYDELALPLRQAVRSLERAEVENLAGEPAAAERQLRAGYDTAASIGARSLQATLGAFLANVLCTMGRYDEALELAAGSSEAGGSDDIATQSMSRCARARALAVRGEFEAAEEVVRGADELAAGTEFPSLQATVLLSLAEVLNAAGKVDEAAASAKQAAAILNDKGNTVAAGRAAKLLSATAA